MIKSKFSVRGKITFFNFSIFIEWVQKNVKLFIKYCENQSQIKANSQSKNKREQNKMTD